MKNREPISVGRRNFFLLGFGSFFLIRDPCLPEICRQIVLIKAADAHVFTVQPY